MKLKTKFLSILGLLAISVTCITYSVSVINARELTKQQAQAHKDEIEKKFDNLKTQNIYMLSLGASFLVADNDIKDLFKNHERDTLYQKAFPLFEKNCEIYGITHVNFIDTTGKVFLRLQDPTTFDDVIHRRVLSRTMQSQKIESSLELGKNSFALRIVTPYYDNDTLIGYIEIARMIDNFLGELKNETGDDFAIYGKKEFLDHNDLMISNQKKALPDTWDALPDDVLLAATSQEITEACIDKNTLATYIENNNEYKEIEYNASKYYCAGFPIIDSEGNTIATIITTHNITPIIAMHQKIFSIELLIILLVFLIIMALFYIILLHFVIRPTQQLTQAASTVAGGDFTQRVSYIAKDEIGELTKFFNIMSTKLSNYQEKLTKESRQLQRHVKEITEKNHQLDESQHATMRALDQVKAAKTLSDSLAHDLQKFKMATDSTSDFIVITDATKKIIYANAAAEHISNCTFEQMQKNKDAIKLFWGGYLDHAEHFEMINTKIEAQEKFSCTVRNANTTNETYYAKISITPIINEDHETIFIVSIGKDITQEKEMDIAKDNFVSLVSHQLRTPLTSIKWLIELLRDPKIGKVTKKQRKLLDASYDSANRLSLLVKDILSINRIEMGRIRITVTPTDIKKLLTDICTEMQDLFDEKSLTLLLPPSRVIRQIDIDPILIRQVITNILSNAIKYTPSHGTITCTTTIIDDHLKIEITDTGIGIPPQDQKRIFERFFRASNAQTKYTDGTGLGLFIAKMLVELCGGTIGFHSQLHHGTTVWFTLPLQKQKHDI